MECNVTWNAMKTTGQTVSPQFAGLLHFKLHCIEFGIEHWTVLWADFDWYVRVVGGGVRVLGQIIVNYVDNIITF